MKKVLLTTTALVAFAGAAAADAVNIDVTGSGRLGLTFVDQATNPDGTSNEVNFSSRIRISFSASGETDGGLAFGGSIRADNASAGNSGSGGSVFISGGFGKLAMGDVDNAAEAAVGDLAGVGYTGAGDYNEQMYLNSSDLPAALYSYSSGDFTVYVGVGNPGGTYSGTATASYTGTGGVNVADQVSVGGSYSFGDFTVMAGYESQTTTSFTAGVGTGVNDDAWIVAGAYTMADTTLKAVYGEQSGSTAVTQYGASVSSSFGATTVSAFVNHQEVAGATTDNYGIGGSYDLGGGASVVGGVAGGDSVTQADLGIKFSF